MPARVYRACLPPFPLSYLVSILSGRLRANPAAHTRYASSYSFAVYFVLDVRAHAVADPWEHVAFAIGGAWTASKLVAWEDEQKAELRKTLERQGRPTTAYARDQ